MAPPSCSRAAEFRPAYSLHCHALTQNSLGEPMIQLRYPHAGSGSSRSYGGLLEPTTPLRSEGARRGFFSSLRSPVADPGVTRHPYNLFIFDITGQVLKQLQEVRADGRDGSVRWQVLLELSFATGDKGAATPAFSVFHDVLVSPASYKYHAFVLPVNQRCELWAELIPREPSGSGSYTPHATIQLFMQTGLFPGGCLELLVALDRAAGKWPAFMMDCVFPAALQQAFNVLGGEDVEEPSSSLVESTRRLLQHLMGLWLHQQQALCEAPEEGLVAHLYCQAGRLLAACQAGGTPPQPAKGSKGQAQGSLEQADGCIALSAGGCWQAEAAWQALEPHLSSEVGKLSLMQLLAAAPVLGTKVAGAMRGHYQAQVELRLRGRAWPADILGDVSAMVSLVLRGHQVRPPPPFPPVGSAGPCSQLQLSLIRLLLDLAVHGDPTARSPASGDAPRIVMQEPEHLLQSPGLWMDLLTAWALPGPQARPAADRNNPPAATGKSRLARLVCRPPSVSSASTFSTTSASASAPPSPSSSPYLLPPSLPSSPTSAACLCPSLSADLPPGTVGMITPPPLLGQVRAVVAALETSLETGRPLAAGLVHKLLERRQDVAAIFSAAAHPPEERKHQQGWLIHLIRWDGLLREVQKPAEQLQSFLGPGFCDLLRPMADVSAAAENLANFRARLPSMDMADLTDVDGALQMGLGDGLASKEEARLLRRHSAGLYTLPFGTSSVFQAHVRQQAPRLGAPQSGGGLEPEGSSLDCLDNPRLKATSDGGAGGGKPLVGGEASDGWGGDGCATLDTGRGAVPSSSAGAGLQRGDAFEASRGGAEPCQEDGAEPGEVGGAAPCRGAGTEPGRGGGSAAELDRGGGTRSSGPAKLSDVLVAVPSIVSSFRPQ